jgi:glycosyltransferase involved in cell wall biosynthesis
MNIHVYTVAYNEELLMPFFLRHYKQFASQITVFDNESTDKTAELAKAAGANVVAFSTADSMMDSVQNRIKNEEYKKSRGKADWVIVIDFDEFLYHPKLLSVLETYKKSGITLPRIVGYDMVAGSFPEDKKQQIYDEIKIGFHNDLYNKRVIFNPSIDICYAIGAHACKPQGNVVESASADLKLFHYRFLGLGYLKPRWERRRDKMSQENLKNKWSVVPSYFSEITRWFYNAKKENKLEKLVDERVRKIQFGCGGNNIASWENYDKNVDLRNPLPYKNSSVDFIFTEHVIEHLFQREAWLFLEESYRVLKRGGVIRLTVPSIVRVKKAYEDETQGATNKFEETYLGLSRSRCWSDGTIKSAIRGLIFNWEHQSLWTPDLLITVLASVGFHAYETKLYKSTFKELCNLEGHWKGTSRGYNDIESFSIEGIKL